MKKNPFISRLATSVAAVALTIGMAFTFSACSDDDEVVDPATTEPSRLSVPTVNEVAEADITTSSLKFSWAAVEGASSYSAQIRLSEAGDIYRERIVEDVTEVTFENLNDNTEYWFRVRANHKLNESRNSAYSEYKMVKTVAADPAIPQLAVPANVMCDKSKTTETELTFMWDSVENATAGYAVTLTSIGKDDVTATTTATTYTFTGLEKGVQYFFTVRACEVKEGDKVVYTASKNSGAVKATTVGQLPAPQNLKAQDKMSQAVKFVWDAVPNAVDYTYELTTYTLEGDEKTVVEGLVSEVSDAIVPGQPVSATVSNTSMTFRGLTKSTYYGFRVKAISGNDAYNDSDFTDYCVIKTLATDATPLTAPILTVKEAQQLKVIVSWNMTGTYGYDIQLAPKATEVADDDATYTIEVRADETTHELATEYAITTAGADALTPDTDYKVRIKTVADPDKLTDADSAWTEWMDVKTAALLDDITVKTADEFYEAFGRLKDGGIMNVEPGTYNVNDEKNAPRTISLAKAVAIVGKAGAQAPKINVKGFDLKGVNGATLDFVRFENIELTGYNTDPATGDPTNVGYAETKTTLSGYVLDGKNCTGKVKSLVIKNCTIHGFINALVRNDSSFGGFDDVLIEGNFVCVGGDNGGIFDENKIANPTKLVVKNNTFDGLGVAYGASKAGQMIRLSSGECEAEITNNTFYNVKYLYDKGKNSYKDLFEVKSGKATVSKNIVTIHSSLTWAKGIGIKATLTSTDNFIFDTTATLEGFTVADPQISGYEFLKNYKPTNAAVIAAGAGDPRWLK